MNASQALNAYRSVGAHGAVTDASPHRLVNMLFEGAMDRVATARGAMERGDQQTQGEALGKAIAIIDNLRASLDLQQGGELAQRLRDLYDYMETRLLTAGQERDVDALSEVHGLLGEIRAGWEGIAPEQAGG